MTRSRRTLPIQMTYLLLGGLLFSTSTRAQTTLLEVDYQSNPVLHVLSDGRVHLPTGAVAGYVLTSDGSGYGTWQAAGSLSLPFSGSTATGTRAFEAWHTATTGVTYGVVGQSSSSSGWGVYGQHNFGPFGYLGGSSVGVYGEHDNGNVGRLGSFAYGVYGEHFTGNVGFLGDVNHGVYGQHHNGNHGYVGGIGIGVFGENNNGTFGYLGSGIYGAYGEHFTGNRGYLGNDIYGAYGEYNNGNRGYLGSNNYGAYGRHNSGNQGYLGSSIFGAQGEHTFGHYGYLGGPSLGVYGEHDNGNWGYLGGLEYGAYGRHTSGTYGRLGGDDYGAFGQHNSGNQGYLGSSAYGVYGQHTSGTWAALATASLAAYFDGDVIVTGSVSKGGGSFKIDHPLDPAGKYLAHSFVESPDMMNVYNGNVVTDARGEAVVVLPAYFEALNRDFRYQLTCLGTFAQATVAEKIQGNRFVIRTDQPNVEVSWQVTGIRRDAWAEANRIVVEEDKPAEERGYYLHPGLYGHSPERSVAWARDPEALRAMKGMSRHLDEERRRIDEERQQIEAVREGAEAQRRPNH